MLTPLGFPPSRGYAESLHSQWADYPRQNTKRNKFKISIVAAVSLFCLNLPDPRHVETYGQSLIRYGGSLDAFAVVLSSREGRRPQEEW